MWRFPDKLLKALPALLTLLAVLAIGYWLLIDPTRSMEPSVPGKDAVSTTAGTVETITIGSLFEAFADEPSDLTDSWTRFRGSASDNIKRGGSPLISTFRDVASHLRWSVELGEGHSGAAIYAGKVYVLDYDETKRADLLRCFSLTSGKELWRRGYDIVVKRNHGMSRTVPAVTDKFVLTIGPRGHVMCVERTTGRFLWGLDIATTYQSEIPLWYTGQCPLIVGDTAIIATGGKALLVGIDCHTGKVLWETPNPDNWKMSHASVMPYTYKGVRMYVYSAVGGVAGVVADGPEAGRVLWQTALWNKSVVAPSAVCMPDGKVFLTAGYGAGSLLLQLTKDNGTWKVESLGSFKPGEALSSEQQTPILLDGHLLGVMPKDARSLRNQLVCVKADNPAEVVWSSGPESRFGLGPYMLADDKLFLLNDDATLYIIKKSLKGYHELDKIALFEGHDAWAPLAVADGYMVLRDSKTMICLDLNQR